MGTADIVTKEYMRENAVFADAFNYLIYNGKKVIDPAKLKEIDPTEMALPFGDEEKTGEEKTRKVQENEWSSVKNEPVKKKTAGRAGKSNDEYLSGFFKEDHIKPVITLVIHFGAEEWDGPLSLHEMMSTRDMELLSFVENYRIHLIDLAKLTEEELNKFSTSMREVMGYIKYSKNKEQLLKFLQTDTHSIISF